MVQSKLQEMGELVQLSYSNDWRRDGFREAGQGYWEDPVNHQCCETRINPHGQRGADQEEVQMNEETSAIFILGGLRVIWASPLVRTFVSVRVDAGTIKGKQVLAFLNGDLEKRAGLTDFQIGVVEGAMNMMAPVVLFSGAPLLMMVFYGMKKLVEKLKQKIIGKPQVEESETGLSRSELF